MVCGETVTSTRDHFSTIQRCTLLQEYSLRRKMNQTYDKFKICSFQNRYYLVSIINRRVLRNSSTLSFSARSVSSSVFVKLIFSKLFIWFALSFFVLNLYSVSGERHLSEIASQLNNANTVYEMDSTSSSDSKSTSYYTKSSNSSCPQCQHSRDIIRTYMLEEIKHTILMKLGFTQGTPNISSKIQTTENPFVKQLINSLYHSGDKHHGRHKPYISSNDELQKVDDDDDRMKTQILLAVAKPCSLEVYCKKHKGHSPLTFLFEQKTAQSKLLNAKLSFYQKAANRFAENDAKINITVYRLNPHNNGHDPYISALSIEEKLNASSKWIEIDIKEQLSKHFKENDVSNISLVIHAVFVNKSNTAKVPIVVDIKKPNDEDSQFVPFIQLKTEELKGRRNKRSAGADCKDEEPEETCCRYPLTVNFEEFNWDFVIAPKKYEAHYCAGECAYLENQKYPHTHILNMIPSDKKRLHGPCCGPRKMAPITMLYFNTNGNIIYGVIPGMVVERCGCS